jgi:hypothetical protein
MEGKETRHWLPGMGEISGVGGTYEAACRKMLFAGLDWFEDHPDAVPDHREMEGIFGIVKSENDDAVSLDRVLLDAAGPGCTGATHHVVLRHLTGAMHHVVLRHLAYVRHHGWDVYVEKMREKHDVNGAG